MPYIQPGRRSAWELPSDVVEETRGGPLSLDSWTSAAESDNGSVDCAVPRGKHDEGSYG
jgi:hypothetical protein